VRSANEVISPLREDAVVSSERTLVYRVSQSREVPPTPCLGVKPSRAQARRDWNPSILFIHLLFRGLERLREDSSPDSFSFPKKRKSGNVSARSGCTISS